MGDAAFFNNINDLVIEGGSFNFNVQHTQVFQRIKFTFSTGRNDTIIPQGAGSRALCLLLTKTQQLIGELPRAHLELARHCAGWGRQHTTTHNLRNNIVSVGVPLFTTSLFSALPKGVRCMAFYTLVAMVVLDILHPMRLECRMRPGDIVKVLDALGKYHDFPWAACENPATFHAELIKRSRNQPGFFFIKSKWYELEYNGRVMQQEDWKAIKPFTDIFVDFVIIQGEAPVVICPWCKRENLLPSSYEESTDVVCSGAQCGRDISVMNSLQAELDNSAVDTSSRIIGGNAVGQEILRLRVKILPSKVNTAADTHPEAFPSPRTLKLGMAGVAELFVRARRAERRQQERQKKSGQAIFTSGEPHTHPGVGRCLQPDQPRIPVEFSESYICSGGVNVVPLLNATRAALFCRVEAALGANTLTDEQWECIITGPKRQSNRIYKVQMCYMACATNSTARDPRRPVCLEQARGIPGLMTIVKRCDY